MTVKLLIVTNMGPKASAPFQGQFVKNQVDALSSCAPAYFYMTWHNDSKLNRLCKYPFLWLQFVWQYVFSRQSYDLLHIHYYYPTIWLAWTYKLLRNPKAKIVVTCHGSDIYLYKPESGLYKFASKIVDHFIFTSTALREKFFNPAIKSTVLPAGIHPTFASSSCLTMVEKSIDVLFVGTLDRNKGIDRLLKLVADLPQVKFAVIGHGPLHNKILEATQKYPNLQLLGSQSPESLRNFLEQSKCLVSLSRNESFGLVMTEAMACYTPVIATFTDGSAAQIKQGYNGYCLDQTDELQLHQSLLSSIQQLLMLSAANYLQLQQDCRASAEPYFVKNIANELMALYGKLTQSQV